MSAEAEVGIVGAGPAGARVAERLSARGVRTVLFDPKEPWEKPCGGGLPPPLLESMPELEELLGRTRRVTRVRVELDAATGFTVVLDRPIHTVSRRVLGEWQLGRALAAGAEHIAEKVGAIRREGSGWRIETEAGPWAVRFLVGADGASSSVRRVVSPRLEVELAPARVAFPPMHGAGQEEIVLRFFPTVAGYLWDFPRLGHRSVGIVVANRRWPKERLDAEIDVYRASVEICSCPEPPRAGAVIGMAGHGHGDYSGIAGVDFALVGDAAGLANPLTGEGIHNALRSADALADAWLSGARERYATLARDTFETELRVARLLRRWVLERWTAAWLVSAAARSDALYAVVCAVTNAINEHDGSPLRLVGRWADAVRAVRARPGVAQRAPRRPMPCRCRDDAARPERPDGDR